MKRKICIALLISTIALSGCGKTDIYSSSTDVDPFFEPSTQQSSQPNISTEESDSVETSSTSNSSYTPKNYYNFKSNDDEENNTTEIVEGSAAFDTSGTVTTEPTKKIENGQYTISGITFNFSDSVRNDTTGKWKISLIADSATPDEYALNYYETLFSSDDEIHAIVNFSLNTTTKISVLYSGVLDVTVLEYVDGEEHDANELFSGMMLDEYWVHTDTGEIERP